MPECLSASSGNRRQDQSRRRSPNGRTGVELGDTKYATSFVTGLGRSGNDKYTLRVSTQWQATSASDHQRHVTFHAHGTKFGTCPGEFYYAGGLRAVFRRDMHSACQVSRNTWRTLCHQINFPWRYLSCSLERECRCINAVSLGHSNV